ncbi:MAG: hypothetical protein ACR2MS_13095 [Weeksellaceae bacterium]
MKNLLWLMMVISALGQAQSIKKGIIVTDAQEKLKVENIIFDTYANQINYIESGGEVKELSLNQVVMIKEQKGSYWLMGALGGLGASLLVSAATAPEDGEWWYGAGPKILIGTGIGAAIGAFIPKYKEVSLDENTSLSFTTNGIKFNF